MKKLAIVGSHSDTRHLAPFDDPEYEIWVFNEAVLDTSWCKRFDASFQMHKPEVYSSLNNWVNKAYWPWLTDLNNKPVYMQDKDNRVRYSTRYPKEEILRDLLKSANLQGDAIQWITSTASYALALALWLGYEIIDIYGVELTSNTEYSYQVNNWQFWVGTAIGMGIKVNIHSGTVHFKGTLYGYEGEIQLPSSYYGERAANLDKLWKQSEWRTRKAKDIVNEAILDRKYDALKQLILDYQAASLETGQHAGALEEAQNYTKRKDPITRQEFERRSAQAQKDGEDKKALMFNAGGKTEYIYNVWRQSGNAEALRQFRQFIQEQIQYAYDTGAHHGIYKENMEFLMEYDARLTAAGGVRTLAALGVNNG